MDGTRSPLPQPALVKVADRELPLAFRRSSRARRVILRLDNRGEAVTVTLPPFASVRDGLALAERAASWLEARLMALPQAIAFADDALIPVLGTPHRIVHDPSAGRRVVVKNAEIRIGGAPERLAAAVRAWLASEARRQFTVRAREKSARLGRGAGRISVRDPVSRWGSCAASGNLSFSWRLILAPEMVLDYVVAHEVAHLAVRGHGPRFWQTVERLTERTSEARAWLRRHGAGLHRYG